MFKYTSDGQTKRDREIEIETETKTDGERDKQTDRGRDRDKERTDRGRDRGSYSDRINRLRTRDLDGQQTMPVGEDGHAVGTAGKLLLRIWAGAPVGLAVECRDMVVAVNGGVLLQTLHSVS